MIIEAAIAALFLFRAALMDKLGHWSLLLFIVTIIDAQCTWSRYRQRTGLHMSVAPMYTATSYLSDSLAYLLTKTPTISPTGNQIIVINARVHTE